MLDNFFKNFFRQCKEPSRFGFYRIAADQVDSMLGVMKDLLQHPYQNKQILAPHKIDTFPYQQQVMEEQAAQQTEKQEPQKQENMEQQKEQQQDNSEQTQGKRGYRPIDESKINWQELEDRWGVKRDDLEKSGDLTKMLHYGKSDLVKVKPTFGGESFELDARLSFKKDGEGNVSLVPHFIRKEQKLDEYKEHKFSDNDRKNLRETGNLGRVVDIVDRETGEIIPPTSASTARRMKSRTFRRARCASRSASARRKSPRRNGTCSAPDCPCATSSSSATMAGSSSPPCK